MVPEYMTGGGRGWSFGIELSPDHTASFSDENFNQSEVDELVIDDWFYLERLDNGYWFLRIGEEEFVIFPDHTLRNNKEDI